MSATDKQIALSTQTTSLTSPQDMASFATTLKQFIVEQRLFTNIQGKNYVHVEAWQFCGAAMGVIAIVKSTERVLTDDPNEYKYRAEVELRRLENDQLVGAGIAFCSNRERTKSRFDEYAVASMAQTRATSKAYRIAFGWLMKVAGYEATPHEEVDGVIDERRDAPPSTKPRQEFPDIEREYAESTAVSPEPATKLQIQRVKSLMKGLGFSDEKIAEGIMKIDTAEDAEKAITSLKAAGGK